MSDHAAPDPLSELSGAGWLLIAAGAISIVAGLLAIAYPDITLKLLAIFGGINLIMMSVLSLVDAFSRHADSGSRSLSAVLGVLSLIAGLLLLRRPGETLLVLLLIFGIWLVVSGAVQFFRSFGDMAGGFRERAERVNQLLADRHTAFLVVTSPRPDVIEEAMYFHHRLLDAGLPFGGVVVNRVHRVEDRATARGLGELLGDELAGRVEANLDDYRRLAEHERRDLEGLRRRLGRRPMIQVPELEDEVHDIDSLRRVEQHLFASGGTA